jgi:N-acylneuraminate cytidylyltransferase/CMP-N,N'-diacetyllegionaminic acid synthase
VISEKKLLALIPARGGSKGLPRKNIIDLCGRPLLGWPIQAASNSKYVDRIIVSTDDPEIAKIAETQGAEVPFIRPPELATDTATSFSVIEHAITYLAKKEQRYDYILLLEPTSPLTEVQDINEAMEKLQASRKTADSIISVSKVQASHPVFDVIIGEDGLIHSFMTQDFAAAGRRQDISDLYFFDGSLYISDIRVYLDKKSFYHKRTLPHIVPKWKSFEVDDMMDLICVEAILNNIDKIKEVEPIF